LFFIFIILFSISFADVNIEAQDEIDYDETWSEPVVISKELYPNAKYISSTTKYHYYDLDSKVESPIVRIEKEALSYDYDIIYDKEDGSHIVNNPLGKEINTEEFELTGEYMDVFIENIEPQKDYSVRGCKLNDYYYWRIGVFENGKYQYKKYKVYKDLVKINSIIYKNKIFVNNNKYLQFDVPEELVGDNKYFVNLETNEIIEMHKDTFVIEDLLKITISFIIKLICVIGIIVIVIAIKKEKIDINYLIRKKSIDNIERKKKNKRYILTFIITYFLWFFSASSIYYSEFSNELSVYDNFEELSSFIWFIVLYIELNLLILLKQGKTKGEREEKSSELNSIDILEKKDPGFNKDEFIQWVESIFIELQTAWTNKDYGRIKIFEDNALYSTHKAQIQRYIKRKKTNYIENVNVKEKYINGYKVEDGFEFINLTLIVDMIDYVKDDISWNIVKGKEESVTKKYSITFRRKEGVTETVGELKSINCPNCGAPVDIAASVVCEHCNSILNTSNHNWVMSKYKEINI